MHPTTPTEITPKLRELASNLQASEPVFVDIRAEPWGQKGNCFKNAERYCEENEGAVVVFGFVLRSNGVWAEAEYHALVRLQSGQLIDPTQEGRERVLFSSIEDERSQASGIHAVALKEYSCVRYFVAIQNQAHLAMQNSAEFDSSGARSYRMTPKWENLMHKHEAALRDVIKAFKKKWPTF